MRNIFLFIFFISVSFVNAQDKVYLKDNSVITGSILSENERFIEITEEEELLKILKKEIAIIVYESGQSKVISKDSKINKDIYLNEWMIGTNILQPISFACGFMIEKNISRRYSVRAGQVFMFDGYYGDPFSYTSLMNNFYFGKGKLKWLVNGGFNLLYSETPYYHYPSGFLINADYETMDLIWMPQNGWRSYLDVEFSFGTGVYMDLTRHCAFVLQMNLGAMMDREYFDIKLDVANSGFSFFYKF